MTKKKILLLYSNSIRRPVTNLGHFDQSVIAYEVAATPPPQHPPIPPPPPTSLVTGQVDQRYDVLPERDGREEEDIVVASPFLIGCLDDIVVQTRSARQDTRKLWDAIHRLQHELRHL